MVKTGVLLTGFGGPDSLESVGPFMCNLMGEEPSDELVARVCKRYLTIGGSSPLTGIAVGIADKLVAAFMEKGHTIPVAVGMRYWHPYIGDSLAALKEEGCGRVITVSLSPFESKVAHGAYREAIDEAVAALGGLEVVEAPLVSELPAYADFFAGSAATGLTDIEPNEGAILVFTAHSLPESDLVDDDPYVTGLQTIADDVAEQLGLPVGKPGASEALFPGVTAYGSTEPPRAWLLAYQSKGNRPGSWLGPDLDEVIDAIGASAARALVVVPIGFMTDHLETLYDLDVIAAERAIDADLEFLRAPVPNDDDTVVAAMANSIISLL